MSFPRFVAKAVCTCALCTDLEASSYAHAIDGVFETAEGVMVTGSSGNRISLVFCSKRVCAVGKELARLRNSYKCIFRKILQDSFKMAGFRGSASLAEDVSSPRFQNSPRDSNSDIKHHNIKHQTSVIPCFMHQLQASSIKKM